MKNQSAPPKPPFRGTNIQGDANLESGDLVARDKIIKVQNLNIGVGAKELLNVLEKIGSAVGAGEKRKYIPPLLPYLVDRSEQEFELQEVFENYQGQYPLVFIVHGDEFQCHDKFLERVQAVSLPRILQLNMERDKIMSYHLEWPPRLSDIREVSMRLQKTLSDAILNYPGGSIAEIQENLTLRACPILLHTHLLSDDWKQHGNAILEHYLRLWVNWPELAPCQRLLVFLFIKYQSKYDNRGFLSFPKSLNERIREQLNKFDFSKYGTIDGRLLMQLESVSQSEAESWARSPEVSAICDSEHLISAIRQFYNKEKGALAQISMEKLVDHLMPIIKENMLLQESA